ncbi:hypothetical protein T440DRAFT_265533 [Plenodomus tracheiphilus IPT5]|uniref:Uncharacterized protein n=1 Tax=Plenodomus tracheiphilus IPT5 TaxID=1408161 RepID=A0A6A7ATP3_9PLEO|nr:hypothetical protein T440DRAFT_265533 [Plenodomus tracheiphilus IPT5]
MPVQRKREDINEVPLEPMFQDALLEVTSISRKEDPQTFLNRFGDELPHLCIVRYSLPIRDADGNLQDSGVGLCRSETILQAFVMLLPDVDIHSLHLSTKQYVRFIEICNQNPGWFGNYIDGIPGEEMWRCSFSENLRTAYERSEENEARNANPGTFIKREG